MVRDLETGGVSVKHQIVKALHGKYSIDELCKFLQISRSGYYKYVKRQQQPHKDEELKEKIRAVYEQRKGRYGYRRIQAELERQFHLKVNHKKVLRMMQNMGLKAKIRRKRHVHSKQVANLGSRIAENLLNRDFHAEAPNQKWVTDVTYIRTTEGWLYLSSIMDLFNYEIISYCISDRNDNLLVVNTVKRAFEKRKDATGVILHSDRGFQYTSHEYHDMLQKVGARISMSRKGNCFDNACIESFFSHLKTEELYLYDIPDKKEAQRRIDEYIRFYNEERIQLNKNKLTPVEYRRQLAA
ncbi:putative transposase InsK for insertion sequence element IS150 [Collibacillus ludicampi]|uniref:Transposase InsK for insertion sequence element IS150 n=1 Tax=Collibacillus ludicampi TaxID=2771369 RepID=A0AAV4LIV6_9BACL|nr:IS3 family transposase [Collibacillus ludicampi]GIM47703.1 putative transposase InsK for insertion sequence element IS150 [Collibacillus ludicampi]